MNERLKICMVSQSGVLKDAMKSLDESALEIALVIGAEAQLEGVITDGDIRRAFLHHGATLESPLDPFIQRKFVSVSQQEGRAEVIDLMQARRIEQIPILDEGGKLVGIHLLHELLGRLPRPNWAVIMAGGKGTRLRPLTENVPKPMIPVAGRPILERLVLHVVSCGIENIFLSVNYLGEKVEAHFGDGSRFGCKIEYLRETEPLGTGGPLSLLPSKPIDPIFVMNGDLISQMNIGSMLQFHEKEGNEVTIGVREYCHTVPFGCSVIEDRKVTEFREKPVLREMVNTGIYVIQPNLLNRIPASEMFPITNLFEDCLQTGAAVGAYEIEEDWVDVGQRDQLQLARQGYVD